MSMDERRKLTSEDVEEIWNLKDMLYGEIIKE